MTAVTVATRSPDTSHAGSLPLEQGSTASLRAAGWGAGILYSLLCWGLLAAVLVWIFAA